MPKISIIIPVYNAEKYIKRCLQSVVSQTYADIEVIIVNDGSKDRSAEICLTFLDDPRVQYYSQKNSGPAIAMNYGLSVATGEYIWFVDADDWIEPDAVERLQRETADMVIFNFYRGANQKHYEPIDEGVYDKKDISCKIFPKLLSYIDHSGNICHIFHNTWMRLYKRDFLFQNNIRFLPDVRNGLDLLFSFEVAVKADTIAFRPNDYLYHYMPADNSMTTSYVNNYWERRKRIIDSIYGLIPNANLHQQMSLRIFFWAVVGIENELHSEQGNKANIKLIITDPVCDIFKGKLDISSLNEKNKRYYNQICEEDAAGIWREYKGQVRKKKRKKAIKKIKEKVKSIL